MKQTVLFLCPHNAAKSVIAAAYFNQFAEQEKLPFEADSAGTEPSEMVSPVVREMLAQEGLDVSGVVPRHITAEDLQNAAHIISMGCTAEALNLAPENIEWWLDVPMVSQMPEQARILIRARVEQLITELRVKS